MRRFVFAVVLVMACATGAAAGSTDEPFSAYERGDYARAAQLFRSNAERGYAATQNKLGAMYVEGQGVPQDFIRAYMWYNVAAAASSGSDGMVAIKLRDDMASRMTAAQIGKAQELARRCQKSKFKECD